MGTNNEDNCKEVTTDSFPFDFERFDFLDKCLKQTKEDFGLRTDKIQITCFDVNQNFFVFGTNCGLIYCFRRHVFGSAQLIKYQLFTTSINLIKLITDELLSFTTESGVYVWNRLSRKFLYGWKCPTKAVISCLQTFMSITDRQLLLFSGDSDGCLRFHNMIECQQNIIYKDFGFPIIQIEFIDNRTLLISSSFKTVIVKTNFSEPNKQKITSVGKNERKTYGKFGAVYSHKSALIYGSRPSLHLIKADITGNVIETIRINNIKESDCSQTLQELVPKPITGKVIYKLGVLQLFCSDEYIISSNDSNLLIIGTDGEFCVKEKVDQLIDVKISAANSNEAFLLLESKHIIRIRNNQMRNCSESETSSEYEKSSESEGKSSDSKSSNESLFNLMKGPVIVNPISFIDEELRKVFDFNALQTKLAKKYNQLSASIISTIDPKILPNYDKNVFVDHEYDNNINQRIDSNTAVVDSSEVTSPLLVTRKGRRRTRHNSSDSQMTINSTTDSVNSNEEFVSNSICREEPFKDNSLKNHKVLEINESNDDNRLEMILSAYREANNITNPNEEQTDDDFTIDDNHLTNGNEITVPTNDEELSVPISEEELKSTELTDKIDSQTNQINVESIETENIIEEVNYCWEQMIRLYESKQNKNFIFSSIRSNGYNSSSEVGLIWFIPKDHYSLIYYPSFDTLKLLKGRIQDMTCSMNELYIVNDSGLIFRREGIDATKPVGTKWSQIKGNKSKFKLTSISLNYKHSMLWCCDGNGETWTYQTKSQKWFVIKDFSSHSIEMRKVCVSPIDANIVWGIDKSGKIFVRSFVKSGDNNRSDSCGDEWLLMDGILAIDIVVCCDNSVLIAVQNNQLYRRSAKIGSNEKINEWKEVNAPEVPEDDSFVSLSGLQ